MTDDRAVVDAMADHLMHRYGATFTTRPAAIGCARSMIALTKMVSQPRRRFSFGRRWPPALLPGMSLRDYYAAHAPISIDNAAAACGWTNLNHAEPTQDSVRAMIWAVMTLMRYEYADAMLEASADWTANA